MKLPNSKPPQPICHYNQDLSCTHGLPFTCNLTFCLAFPTRSLAFLLAFPSRSLAFSSLAFLLALPTRSLAFLMAFPTP